MNFVTGILEIPYGLPLLSPDTKSQITLKINLGVLVVLILVSKPLLGPEPRYWCDQENTRGHMRHPRPHSRMRLDGTPRNQLAPRHRTDGIPDTSMQNVDGEGC